jgi:transposase
MPWKECHVMDERLRFVARLLEGEKMAPLCAAFGISRKTGYKIFERYKDCGVAAFSDRSRRPYRQANRLPPQLEAVIVRLKREYPGWGAPKIREKLRRQSTAPHSASDQHGPCSPGPTRTGEAAPAPAPRRDRHRADAAGGAQCTVVR